MKDAALRELLRRALLGDAEAREALDAHLDRLGGAGAELRPPRQLPPLVADYSDPVLYQDEELHDACMWWTPGSRSFAKKKGHRRQRGRVRRALRQVRPEDWDDL